MIFLLRLDDSERLSPETVQLNLTTRFAVSGSRKPRTVASVSAAMAAVRPAPARPSEDAPEGAHRTAGKGGDAAGEGLRHHVGVGHRLPEQPPTLHLFRLEGVAGGDTVDYNVITLATLSNVTLTATDTDNYVV